jgi:hypothetical protein
MPDAGNPIPAPAPRHSTPAGVVGLFGLFSGLCAVFAALVTLGEWRDDTARAAWPHASALIEQGYVSEDRPRGGSTTWRLRYRVRYEVDGRETRALLTSYSTNSQGEAAKMQAWARRHRAGGSIDVRYDPSRPEQAVFASAEVPDAGPRTRSNLILTAIAVVGCAVLLPLARFMQAREAPDAATKELSPGGRIALGVLCAALGVLVSGMGVRWVAGAANALASENLVLIPAGLMFVFGGALVALPPGRPRLRSLLGALLISAFALTFDWIAFGPGERRFSGGISFGIGIGFNPGELFGRAAFGLVALLFDAMALVLWVRLFTVPAARE